MNKRSLGLLLVLCLMLSVAVAPAALAAAATECTGDCTHAAAIGDIHYDELSEAVEDAQLGDTVTLLRDVTLTSTVRIESGKTVTIDLNGKIIDGTENCNIALMSYGNLTVKDSSEGQTGAIKAGKTAQKSGNTVNICGGTFTLESGSIYSVNNAILIDEQAAVINIKGGTITAEPTTTNSAALYISSTSDTTVNITGGEIVGYNGILLWNNSTINMTGGSIDAPGSVGIQGNGNYDNTEINLSGTASVAGYYAAIYHPQAGELNISGNATLTGWTGVVVKGGNVTISGGTISGTGEATAYAPASSGFVDTGDGLYVEHYDNSTNSENYGTPTVTVTGGTFTSTSASAVASYANINNADNGVEAITGFISGGTYSSKPDDSLIVEGAKAAENSGGSTWGIVPDTTDSTVATVGNVAFDSLQAAVNAAEDGDTVTLLQSVAMSSDPYAFVSVVTIDKALTLDLNGMTISHTGDKYSCAITVNTPSASDAVIIKNGTVSSESGTGTNFAVVMVETGAVTLEGVTVTNGRSDAYGNNAVRTVSTGSVTLTGECTVTGYLSGTGSIKIQSGTYKSIIAGNNSLGTGIEVSGGTFEYEVTMEDCAVGYKPQDNGDGTWTVEVNPFLSTLTINNIDDLKVFRDMVNAGNDFSGKTITLAASIDLNNEAWTPIGTSANRFKGTFDGRNNTISNLCVTQSDNAGLFGYIEYATIKDLTVDNVNIPATGTGVGAVVGRSINGVKLENVKVTGTVKITGLNYVGGIIGYGWSNYAYTNCSVDAADGSYVKGATPGEGVESNYTSYVGGLVGYGGPGGKITGCSVNNLGLSTYYDNTYTAYGIGGLNGMAQTGVVIDGCSVTNVTIDAAETTATGTVVGSNNGTVADPVWLNNTTISNVTVTVREAAATADMIGTHGLNGDQMVKGCAFIGTGMQRDSNGKLIAGTFNGDVTAYVAADYQCIKNADETWSVVPVSVTVTFNSNGGSAVENQSVSYGGTATRPADPTRSGHIFLGWYLGGASYDFSTPVTSNITLVANWAIYIPAPSIPSTPVEPEWVNPFSDVADDAYYTDAVLWAVANDITTGTGDGTTFSPDADCTRGQIVTFLWRAQGSEDVIANNPFVDVADDAYYTEAVLWAVENSITNGTGANTFSPDADCTRAQIVTFLYRCLAQ